MSENMLGVMIDCSRNAVMNVAMIKKYICTLEKMGYNTLMLYTEDTYEVNDEPLFGYLRGRYTKAEMKELDAFAKQHGIEMIPCIQTLAHLNCIFKWWEYNQINDCDDILLAEEERTYELIDRMFATLSECYSSRRIHIGMDEAYRVGLGKYLEKHGAVERFDLINRHLHRVCKLADKYGFKPMIWSDMFIKLALDQGDYYASVDFEAIKEKAALPENVSLVYWDYYHTDYESYDRMIKANQAFDKEVIFGGGAWTWRGLAPDNHFSMETTLPAIKACRDNGVDEIFITIWGDDGAECSRWAILPSLFYTAELLRGNEDLDSIKKKFYEMFNAEFDSFMMLDELNILGGKHSANPCNYLLYNDLFTGLNDYRATAEDSEHYRELKTRIDAVIERGEYGFIFETASALCDVLAVKADLGVRTRALYQAGDKAVLKELAENEYADVLKKLQVFHAAFQAQWLTENKPNGFDIQDIRLGGIMQRVRSCRERLLKYVAGEVDEISELAENLLEVEAGPTWARYSTPNVVSHFL